MTKILLVEDDQSIARLERDYLEINGFTVLHDSAGDLTYILSVLPEVDLVILDLMLPKADGFQICKELRAITDKPILIVSAKDQDMDVVLGLGFGANDYVKKPFSPSELVARVKSHLANYARLKGSDQTEEKIEIRGMVVAPLSNAVTVNGQTIDLTRKEFDILFLFVKNKGRVFSKKDIYERIWEQDALGYYETVSVHVRRIREKIEPNPAKPIYIETIWGVGYCIK